MATDKISGKGNLATLEINDKVIAKSKQVLESMLEEVKNRAPKKPAETIVKENISTIDKLSKSGVSLPKIYERLNKEIPLGITSASFTQYVRNVRKQVGSELYKELGKRKSKKQINNDNFKCECCKTEAEIYESEKINMKFWYCKKCDTFYHDENDSLSSKQLDETLIAEIRKK